MGRPRHQPGLEGSLALKGTQEAPAWWCNAGSRVGASRRMSRRFAENMEGRGQTYALVGPVALLPFSLCSYLSLRSCLSWMQIYAAKSER